MLFVKLKTECIDVVQCKRKGEDMSSQQQFFHYVLFSTDGYRNKMV